MQDIPASVQQNAGEAEAWKWQNILLVRLSYEEHGRYSAQRLSDREKTWSVEFYSHAGLHDLRTFFKTQGFVLQFNEMRRTASGAMVEYYRLEYPPLSGALLARAFTGIAIRSAK